MASDLETLPVANFKGDICPQITILRCPDMLERTYVYGRKLRRTHEVYELKYTNRDPESGVRYIESELRQSQLAAAHMVSQGILPQSEKIPVLYAPDGGIHTASGFLQGIGSVSTAACQMFPVIENPETYLPSELHMAKKGAAYLGRGGNTLSTEVIEQIKYSGAVVFCDSVIIKGPCASIMHAIPDDLYGPGGIPIRVIFYANLGYGHETPGNPSRFNAAATIVESQKPNTCISVYLADIGKETDKDHMSRGDIIARTDHEFMHDFYPFLLNRKVHTFSSHLPARTR